MNTVKLTHWAVACIMLAVLPACTGYRAYQNGHEALAQGRWVEGIEQLKQASDAAPENADYRRAYFSKRDQASSTLSRQAQVALDRGDVDAAQDAYEQIAKIQSDSPIAISGLNRIEGARRHQKLLDTARNQAQASDLEGALSKVHQVLSENPNNRMALALQRKLQRQQADATGKELGIYPKLNAVYRKPVSLSFNAVSLKQVFEALKLASGLNYMLDKDVQSDARVTISVTNKPVEDVLRLILASNQLERRVLDGDTLLIYPNTPAKAADYREMVVRSFYISNADINKTATMVKTIAKAKDVFVDDRTNLLVVRDSAEVIRLAERLIAAQDMPEPEVMLELEVLEVSVNRLMEMGIHWPDSLSASIKGAGGAAGVITLPELRQHSENLVQLSFPNPLISARLRSAKGDANLLANPRVRVRNKQAAKILIGEKVPVITTSTTANVGTAESVSYLDVGLKLDIEPTVALDDDVTMKLSLEVSNILDTITRASGTQTYRLGTRNTSTTLRVHDGETNVLAGLIQREDRRSNSGLPGLNELPLISRLFGSAQDSDTRTEIILLITPRIVRNLDIPGVGQQEFLAGTENALGASPIQLGGTVGATQATPPTPPTASAERPVSATASTPAEQPASTSATSRRALIRQRLIDNDQADSPEPPPAPPSMPARARP